MAELVSRFVEMTGCSRADAIQMLERANLDMNKAMNMFFDAAAAKTDRNPKREWTVTGKTSQFTFGARGRSACTLIALLFGKKILQVAMHSHDKRSNSIDVSKPSSDFIDATIREGAKMFETISSLGHTSMAELLAIVPGLSSKIEVLDVKQRILDVKGTSFKESIEHAIDIAKKKSLCAFAMVVTKPPETLVCVLSADGSQCYVLDSHPRQKLGLRGGHMIKFESVGDMCTHLSLVFPFVDFGSDVATAQRLMYNSFDTALVVPCQKSSGTASDAPVPSKSSDAGI